MVGVPALARWVAGPSSRTIWPICIARRRRITHGPSRSVSANAVRLAAAVRKVMYCVTFRTLSSVRNGYSR